MHPEQSEAYLEAWEQKQEREDRRHAEIMYLLALSAEITIHGRRPKLADFLPSYCKQKDAEVDQAKKEEELKRKFKLLAKATQHLKRNG